MTMDLQINRNFNAFEVYTKEHFNDMLCYAEKERNIASLMQNHRKNHLTMRKNRARTEPIQSIQLQDCPISPSFWVNPV